MFKPWTFLPAFCFMHALLWITPQTMDANTTAPSSVQSIRYWAANGSIRAVIELNSDARYKEARIADPDRIYFDISNARLSEDFQNRNIPVKEQVLKRIRVAQNRSDLVRVVFDISGATNYSVSELHNPFRILLDLHGPAGDNAELNSLSKASVSNSDKPGSKADSMPILVPNPTPNRTINSIENQAVSNTQVSLTPPEVNGVAPSAQSDESKEQSPLLSTMEVNTFVPAPQETALLSLPLPLEAVPSPSPVGPRPLISISFTQDADISDMPPIQSNASKENAAFRRGRPFTISGTFTTGYYSTYTRGGGNENQNLSFAPATAAFNINGYFLTPDLLDYSIQPEFNASPQASDAGFQGGNGLRMRFNALQHKGFPVTFRYSNVELKDAYFGSLSQLSSYTLKNRTKELGLTTQLNHAGLPTVTADLSKGSIQSESLIPEIPDYISHSYRRNIDLNYQKWGWDFRGFTGTQKQTSNLFTLANDGLISSDLDQKSKQYRGSATRTFLHDSEFYMDVGSQSTATLLLGSPIDLTSRFANANLRLFQRRRWKTSLRAGYMSNISDQLLTGLVGELSGSGSVVPDEGILLPLQRTTSNLNLSGLTSVDLKHGLGIYLSVDHAEVSPSGNRDLRSNYLTTAGGATYSQTFGWGNLSAQYGRSYGNGSVTGQTGRIEGQNYVVTAQPGKWDALQLTFSVRGTNQRIFSELPAHEQDFTSEGSIGLRLFGSIRARVGGGWQKSVFTNAGSIYRTEGYTGRAAIEHPRFQISGSLNSSAGNSLHSYDQVYSGIGLGSASLTPLQIMPSDFKGFTFSLHAIPLRKIELSALYTRSIQHMQSLVSNDFEILDLAATFNFRKLQLAAGFLRSTQDYSSFLTTYPETQRGRFYIRISRSINF